MPNIEIHGFWFSRNEKDLESAARARERIEIEMEKIGLQDDAVVTIVDSICTFCDGKKTRMPFIRICSTEKEEIDRIVSAIKKAKVSLDVETLVLTGFIPADEMK